MTGRVIPLGRGRRFAMMRGFRADETGAVTLLTGFILMVSIGIAAISIDGSNYFYLRRVQQTATDIAAVSAASNPAVASALATMSSATNGFQSSAVSNVEVGTYSYDPAVAPAQRFLPGVVAPNAVRVTMATRPPFIFGGMLNALVAGERPGQPTGFQVRTQAVATNQDAAAFSLGTGLAQLNGGVENSLLGALLGSQLSLSVMDWQALASAKVDLFAFATALNTRAQLSAATFGDVAKASVTRTQALKALGDALAASGGGSSATAAMAAVTAGAGLSTAAVRLPSLMAFGPFGDTSLTTTEPLTAAVSALDLLSAILQVANGTSEVQADLAFGIPGLLAAHLKLAIGEPALSTSLITVGAKGTSLHSAQTRLLLTLRLAGAGVTPTVDLPLYLELAPGTAQLSSVNCTNSANQATLSVSAGVVDAWIGQVSDADLVNLVTAPNPAPATFFSLLGLAQVTGRAHAAIANTTPTAVSFSQADIAASTRKTVSTTDFTTSLYASLLSGLSLNVAVLGGGLGVPAGLDTSVKQVLSTAAIPVDQALNTTLATLGLTLGSASTWVSGVKCGRAVLVD